jgi:uncharacterized protein YecE (DUF72 family)
VVKAKKTLLSPEEYRARRPERRAKQREANVGRAKKMHVARLAGINIKSDQNPIPYLNVGCSGWFYWDWKDHFYPPRMPIKEWFSHYSAQFDTVELNAPFYSWPTLATVQSWVRQAQERQFFYSVKVCELITHVKQFVRTAELVKDFMLIDRLLKPHMGCFLFQLPPSFHYSPARLKRILDQLNPSQRNVVEFRHKSWWNERVFLAFKKAKIIFCSCSAPNLPDDLVQTSDEVYIRFHGLKRWYRHDYTAEEIALWTNRVGEYKPKRVWAYFNNDFGGHAIENAREFIRQLKETNIFRKSSVPGED